MKIYALLLLLAFPLLTDLYAAPDAASKRINGLLRFIANQETLRGAGLYTLIAKRCNRYLPYFEQHACREAVKNQIEILDYDIIFSDKKNFRPTKDAWDQDSFVFIAFKKTLIDTLSDPKTTVYLDEMKKGLNDYFTGVNKEFNIWDMTLKFYNSPLIAAKTIAALFQDTSIIKLHLAYLERTGARGRMSFGPNLERLSKVIDTINLILDYSEDSYRSLFYPKPLREHLNRNIYHFYVPLYLAMALERQGLPRKDAITAPTMLTMTYEFITMASDYRYLLKDPERLDPVKNAHTLRDIFAGFSGANFGLGKDINSTVFLLMREQFARSSHEGVEFLIQSAN